MPYLITFLVALALLVGFLALTFLERAHGFRLFGRGRRALDAGASSVAFIVRNVDLSAFVKETVRSSATHVVHDVAHGALVIVRAVERGLTGAVRALRTRRDTDAARPSPLRRAASYAAHAFRARHIRVMEAPKAEERVESEGQI